MFNSSFLERFRRHSWGAEEKYHLSDDKLYLAELRATIKIFDLARMTTVCEQSNFNFIVAYFSDLFSEIIQEEKKRIISVNNTEVKRLEKERIRRVKLVAKYLKREWATMQIEWSDRNERQKRLGFDMEAIIGKSWLAE
jgi:hypothetical protein